MYQNDINIISLLLRNKIFSPLRKEYGLNYHCVTVLLSCWFYSKYIKDKFAITAISRLLNYYNNTHLNYYFPILIEKGLMVKINNSYSLTQAGFSAIQTIQDNYNTVLYSFCNEHNINL